MNFSGLCAIFTACLKLAAGARTLFVNLATDLAADFADQRDAMHRLAFRAFHAHMVRADCGGQLGWHRALLMRAGFAPIKGYAERCTARSALDTF